MSSTVILYDADCGFCRWSLGKVLVWDRRRVLRPVPLQAPEADRLLARMDRERRMASWHLVTADGDVHSGGAAFAPLARLLPGGRPLAALAAAFPGASERAYRSVADRRELFGRLLQAVGSRRASRRAAARIAERT
jgi:predicted DCC family thiol-disulfide oxidoreductase YuxK